MIERVHRYLRVGSDADVARLRTHHSLDWPAVLVVSVLGFIAAAIFVPGATVVAALLGSVCAWMMLQRTTIDRRRRVSFSHAVLRSPRGEGRPLGTLAIRRRKKVSKGTVTVSFELLSGGQVLADGLVHRDAEALAAEVAEWLGEPTPPMPAIG